MYRFLPQLQAPCRGLSWLIAVKHMTSKTVDVECNAYQNAATGLAANCRNGGSASHLDNLEFIPSAAPTAVNRDHPATSAKTSYFETQISTNRPLFGPESNQSNDGRVSHGRVPHGGASHGRAPHRRASHGDTLHGHASHRCAIWGPRRHSPLCTLSLCF